MAIRLTFTSVIERSGGVSEVTRSVTIPEGQLGQFQAADQFIEWANEVFGTDLSEVFGMLPPAGLWNTLGEPEREGA